MNNLNMLAINKVFKQLTKSFTTLSRQKQNNWTSGGTEVLLYQTSQEQEIKTAASYI